MKRQIPNWIVFGLIAIASLIYFNSRFGLRAMQPTNVDWVMAKGSDWTPDYLAWKYYRYQPWSFPLGIMEGYSHPQKVSIGLTGAIPLLAVPLKLISPILPDDFQYHGFWLFLCSFLQGVFAFLLIRAFGVKEKVYALLGALIFTFSYSMMDRLGHVNLCAHWTVLAGLLIYFSKFDLKRSILYFSLLVFATIWIHPYLVIFSVGLTAITFIERWWSGSIQFKEFAFSGILTGCAAIFAWWLIGNFVLTGKNSQAGGFGEFSTNLNTFWTPKFDTPFLSHTPNYFEGQFEGIAYLGIGILLLSLLVAILLIIGKVKIILSKRTALVFTLGILFFLFSLSHQITYGDNLWVKIPYSKYLLAKFATLRASGRYVWLLQYLILLYLIVALYRSSIALKYKTAIISIVLLLNIVDFNYYFKRNVIFTKKIEPIQNFDTPSWEKIIGAGEEVLMYPPHVRTYFTSCDETPFISIAASQRKPINTGHLARKDEGLRANYKRYFEDRLNDDLNYFKKKIIITTPKYTEIFQSLVKNKMVTAFKVNGFLAYLPISEKNIAEELKSKAVPDSINFTRESFSDFWARNKDYVIIAAVKDDAANHLDYCEGLKNIFATMGSELPTIEFRDSYAGIFDTGNLIVEKRSSEKNKKEINLETTIEGFKVDVSSAGMDYGNMASIKIDGKEYAIDERGLNFVVFDKEKGEVIERTYFDTYMQCFHNSDFVQEKFLVWRMN